MRVPKPTISCLYTLVCVGGMYITSHIDMCMAQVIRVPTIGDLKNGYNEAKDKLTNGIKSLSPAELAKQLSELSPKDLEAVIKDMTSPDLGALVDKLSDIDLRASLSKLPPESFAEAINKLDPTTAIRTIVRFDPRTVPWDRLDPSRVPWDKLDPSTLPWDTLDPSKLPLQKLDPSRVPWDTLDPSKVRWDKLDPSKFPWDTLDYSKLPLEKFDPSRVPWDKLDPSKVRWEQLDLSRINWEAFDPKNIPWEKLDPSKFPWEKLNAGLDPKAIPWSRIDILHLPWTQIDPTGWPWTRIDPSQVKWSTVNPSKWSAESKQWIGDRVSATKDAGTKAFSIAKSKVIEARDSIAGGRVIADFVREGKNFEQHVEAEALRTREYMEVQAETLTESMKTEVGRLVSAVKQAGWYQELQKLLLSRSRVTVYDMTSTSHLTVNFTNGAYHFDYEVIPALSASADQIETYLEGDYALPDVDPIELAASVLRQRVVNSNSPYGPARDSSLGGSAAGNVYFSSERFVEWASDKKLVEEGVKIYYTGNKGAKDAIREAKTKILLEYNDICVWMKARLRGVPESVIRDNLKGILGAIVLRKPYRHSIIEGVDIRFEWIPINYDLATQAVGASSLPVSVLNDVLSTLKLPEVEPRLDLSEHHMGFAIIIDDHGTLAPFSALDAATNAGTSAFGSLNTCVADLQQGEKMLVELLRDIPGGGAVAPTLKSLVEDQGFQQRQQSDLVQKIRDRLAQALKLEDSSLQASIRSQGLPIIVNLKDTALRSQIESLLTPLSFGNEREVTVDKAELNLGSLSLEVTCTVRSRHVWNVESAISGAWDHALSELDDWSRRTGKQLSGASKDAVRTIVEEEHKAVKAANKAIQEAKRFITGKLQSFILWQFLEEPHLVDFSPSHPPALWLSDHPVYYVNGILNTLSDAKESAQDLADALKRPVKLIYNPSFINTDPSSSSIGVERFSTGTPGVGNDLGECIYDRTWPAIVASFGGMFLPDTIGSLFEKPSADSVRLQKNPTTRQVAHLLYYADEPISLVSHSQGCMIVRNACLSLELLGSQDKVRNNLAWLACGSPLGESEVFPKPRTYRAVVHGNDIVGKLVAFKGGEDGKLFPVTDHGFKNYHNEIRASDLFASNEASAVADGHVAYLTGREDVVLSQQPTRSLRTPVLARAIMANVSFRQKSESPPTSAGRSDTAVKRKYKSSVYATAGHFNKDRFSDLAFVFERHSDDGRIERRVRIAENNRRGAFVPRVSSIDNVFPDIDGKVVCGDINGDSIDDLAILPSDGPGNHGAGVFVRLARDVGQFEDLLYVSPDGWESSGPVKSGLSSLADWDGDGFADLCSLDPFGGSWEIRKNTKGGGFAEAIHGETKPIDRSSIRSSQPLAGDWDDDGRTDFLEPALTTESCAMIWRGRDIRTDLGFSQPRFAALPVCGSNMFAGDWNGDGITDVGAISGKLQLSPRVRYSVCVCCWVLSLQDNGVRRATMSARPWADHVQKIDLGYWE